jgi:hypothetical protein
MIMNLCLAQNKRRLKMHKESNNQIKNIEEYKISLTAHCAIFVLAKKR